MKRWWVSWIFESVVGWFREWLRAMILVPRKLMEFTYSIGLVSESLSRWSKESLHDWMWWMSVSSMKWTIHAQLGWIVESAHCCAFLWVIDSVSYSIPRTELRNWLIEQVHHCAITEREWFIEQLIVSAAIHKMSVEQTMASGWRTGLKWFQSIFYKTQIFKKKKKRKKHKYNQIYPYGRSDSTLLRKPWTWKKLE